MALYEILPDELRPLSRSSFADAGMHERYGLQKRLRDHIDIIAPGGMVLAEEFDDWEDARRRIDLLGLDPDGTLVVIELKVTQDGGHMELQALRYAAMVSTMTFDQAVAAHERYLARRATEPGARQRELAGARERILRHLGRTAPEDGLFGDASTHRTRIGGLRARADDGRPLAP